MKSIEETSNIESWDSGGGVRQRKYLPARCRQHIGTLVCIPCSEGQS